MRGVIVLVSRSVSMPVPSVLKYTRFCHCGNMHLLILGRSVNMVARGGSSQTTPASPFAPSGHCETAQTSYRSPLELAKGNILTLVRSYDASPLSRHVINLRFASTKTVCVRGFDGKVSNAAMCGFRRDGPGYACMSWNICGTTNATY
jgi:hypothetical protein